MRSKIFEDYVPVIIEEAAALAETGVPDYKPVLAKVTRRALAELMGEKVEEEIEEEDFVDSLLEELDEFGHVVDKEHSSRKDRVQESDLDEAFLDDEKPRKKKSSKKKTGQSTLFDSEDQEE